MGVKKKDVLSLLIVALCLSACNFNNTFINRDKDNAEGKAFLKLFYYNISIKKFELADRVIDDSLRKEAGPNGISSLLKLINKKAGDYEGYTINDYFTKCISGSINETSYSYKLKVRYKKGTVEETIGLIKENGSEIKIYSYHVNSALLLQ